MVRPLPFLSNIRSSPSQFDKIMVFIYFMLNVARLLVTISIVLPFITQYNVPEVTCTRNV